MKSKIILGTLVLGIGLLAASCNKKELTTTGGEVLATFTISTPGTMTKAETAGKGERVDKVKCVTFDDAGAEIAALTQTVPVASKKATYSTRLVKGQAYRVAFFAYNEAAAAYDLTDLKNITVKDNQPANAEGRDAFTAFVDISATDTEAPISKEVHLYRPFAQLNIACSASDLAAAAAAGITVAQSKVKISGTGVAFGAFNAYEDKVAGTAIDEVEYSLANIIAGETITVDNVTYNILSMNYFLVGDKGEKNTATVEFEWAGSSKSGSATWTNVPLQRNYRTNIIGDILTNPAAFNIIVDDPFDGDHNIFVPWNGSTSAVTPNGDVYEIANAAELAWVAEQVNSGANTFEGKTVKLVEDIELSDIPWTAIGVVFNNDTSKSFKGSFDGQGHTVYNLNVSDSAPNFASAGLFGCVTEGGKVENVKIENATVKSTHYAGAVVGYLHARNTQKKPIASGCSVKNAIVVSKTELLGDEWDNGDKAGGVVGYGNNCSILNCTVEKVSITGYRDLGGIVGRVYDGVVTGNTLKSGVSITVDPTHNYKNFTSPDQYNANDYVGFEENHCTVSNNTGTADIYRPKAVASVVSAAELQTILTAFTASGAGDNVINIENDLVLAAGETWTPVVIQGYTGAGAVTINGNGHKITGLNNTLIASGFAGHSGAIFNDLTIENLNITDNTSTLGVGAFVGYADAMEKVELHNCHLIGSTIVSTAGARLGGLIGWTSGYNGPGAQHENIVVENCSVENCSLTAEGSVGAIIGHAGSSDFTTHTIEDCKITGCTLNSTDTGGWRVGLVVGTANVGEVTINRITESGNTITQVGKTAPAGQSNLYGRFVPGSTGTLTIDGTPIQ